MKCAAHIAMTTLLLLSLAASAHATPITYTALLNGLSESPANASPAIGFATVIIDTTANTLNIFSETFTSLTGTSTASHIHCCTTSPGTGTVIVATELPAFSGFPLGVTSGSYSMAFDLTQALSWNPAFITAHGGTPASAEADLAAGLLLDEAYLDIHTSNFPGGEIRGFLTPAATVPEPASLILVASGLIGVGARRLRRSRTQ